MRSIRVNKIRYSKVKSCLKTLKRVENGELPFSKRIMAKMRPWNFQMCLSLGIQYPATFEEVSQQDVRRIVNSYRFNDLFLDIFPVTS